MLNVYKASAGSGKTFQLVVQYLLLLLDNPINYRHILAVTFTNKATNEMKSRILEQLHLLSAHKPSAYLDILQEDGRSEEQIRRRARIILKNILHDYNRFSISTIDSFTQRVIKSFNRELGISPHFTLELDQDMILEEAVDRLLAQVGERKNLLEWLKQYSREKMQEGRSHKLEEDIKSLGKELFKENFQLFFPLDSDEIYSHEKLDAYARDLQKIKQNFERGLKAFGKKGVEIITSNQLTASDFKGGARSAIGKFFFLLENGEEADFKKTVLDGVDDPAGWYTKTSKKKDEIQALAENQLQPLLKQTHEYFEKHSEDYFTTQALIGQVRRLGILADLRDEIQNLLKEKGALQISDSNLLLHKIIDQSDTPFIYEKTGSYYKHFMLDEFQDTSTLQWSNFKPLVVNSLAEGNQNLIVGDVKQSIYRWRNSDWKILGNQLNQDFSSSQMNEHHLTTNWRSSGRIIEFNNQIFEELKEGFAGIIDDVVGATAKSYKDQFRDIYSDVKQEQGNSKADSEGYVKIEYLGRNDFRENSLEKLIEEIKNLQDKGLKASDIAILTRTNKEGQPIVEAFFQAAQTPDNKPYNLSVLSNESLFLQASDAVGFVILVIDHLMEPDNPITQLAIYHMWKNWLKPIHMKLGLTLPGSPPQQTLELFQSDSMVCEFSESFARELLPSMEMIRQQWFYTSIDELISQICDHFHLFSIEGQLPFIQTIIDKAAELKNSLANDLSNFRHWWNDVGKNISVTVNEELDSIRLMTVHKSKGLEFKAVCIPFLDWPSSMGSKGSTIWCSTDKAPFDTFSLLPVKADDKMKKSVYKEFYNREFVDHLTDILNLVYVAFTRAKNALIVHAQQPAKSNSRSTPSVNKVLRNALENLNTNQKIELECDEDKSRFEYGSLGDFTQESSDVQTHVIRKYQYRDYKQTLRLRRNSENFFNIEEGEKTQKNLGRIIHEILAEVDQEKDIEKACRMAYNKGILTEKELVSIQESLNESLKNPLIKSWFNGNYKVLNERSILSPNQLQRPDRILLSDQEAIVIDYKTGDHKRKAYHKQVEQYAQQLKASGIPKVRGYLWYINLGEVDEVV